MNIFQHENIPDISLSRKMVLWNMLIVYWLIKATGLGSDSTIKVLELKT